MSFRANQHQQISLFDHKNWLTKREQKALEKSWAKVFADEIFPAIDETRFSVLYSDKASRPNTPVNIIVGALIIKELFDLSDDEVVENLMLDIHLQYALHTTSYEEQPLSDKTLSRFRKRCYDYERNYGIDLFHDCICDLNNKIAKMMNINSHIKRMDSLMIEANIKKMSRVELLYTCVANLAKHIYKTDKNMLPESLLHYCNPDDRNLVIYHSRNIDVNTRINIIINEADELIKICKDDFYEVNEYKLLLRCLEEQTIIDNGIRRIRDKGDELPSPKSLQSPYDPEATFRTKAGKKHVGYIANVVETVSESGSVITDYQYEENVYADSRFLGDYIERTEPQEETMTIVADGGYVGQSNRDAASEKNIEIVNTALMGTPVPDIYADFVISEDGKQVIQCPCGHKPIRCHYIETSKQIKSYFSCENCVNCSYKNECNAKIRKSSVLIPISHSAVERAKQQRQIAADDFQNWRRIRNGVEAVPSILRNMFNVDKIPVHGKIPSKFFFGSKISALNFRKLFRHRKGFVLHPVNPLLTKNAS